MFSKCNISLFSDVSTVSYALFTTTRTVTLHGCCGDNVLLLFKHFLCQHKHCHQSLNEGNKRNIQVASYTKISLIWSNYSPHPLAQFRPNILTWRKPQNNFSDPE
jgi:hypothetical protein